MSFNALIVNKDDDGNVSQNIEQIEADRLPEGDVTVAVEYSTVNYKDGLCINATGGLVRNFPHVPGSTLPEPSRRRMTGATRRATKSC